MSARRGTYSIVAHCPETGEVGAAVQSHWFSVGSIVCWARAGVGAVCTQSIAEPAYGPRTLDRLAAGEAPEVALHAQLRADEQAPFRQVAAVDADGRTAVHTGARCIAYAGHVHGAGFTTQGNMMASDAVWGAMAEAYEAAGGALGRRLLAGLQAAEGAGGDARGRQSSAIVVAPGTGEPWRLSIDLRVEDHPDPLGELERLLDLKDAYTAATLGDDLTGEGRHEEAAAAYERAAALAPGNHELLFWAGLAAALDGDLATGVARVRRAIDLQPGWRELLDRLEPDVAPSAAAVRAEL
jgi:uncharacterized Ntn-hydrolase superfamily protein